jgi:hypothetical protein
MDGRKYVIWIGETLDDGVGTGSNLLGDMYRYISKVDDGVVMIKTVCNDLTHTHII